MNFFCTYFDKHFLARGLALYNSLQTHAAPFRLWVLCFDDVTFDALTRMGLPGLTPIRLAEFEEGNPDLKAVEKDRSRVEYFFTCTPALPLHILKTNPDVDLITYLDADLYFFSSPQPLYEELRNASVLVIEHRFPAAHRSHEQYGRFNVGFLSFRNDATGLECLRSWRAECIEWCYDRLEDGKYADQKYLDTWPHRFKGVVVSQLKGANLAPWNVFGHDLAWANNRVTVDEQELIFFHFHQLKILSDRISDPGLWRYEPSRNYSLIRDRIYRPYLTALARATRNLPVMPGSKPGARLGNRSVLGSVMRSLVRGQLLITPNGIGSAS